MGVGCWEVWGRGRGEWGRRAGGQGWLGRGGGVRWWRGLSREGGVGWWQKGLEFGGWGGGIGRGVQAAAVAGDDGSGIRGDGGAILGGSLSRCCHGVRSRAVGSRGRGGRGGGRHGLGRWRVAAGDGGVRRLLLRWSVCVGFVRWIHGGKLVAKSLVGACCRTQRRLAGCGSTRQDRSGDARQLRPRSPFWMLRTLFYKAHDAVEFRASGRQLSSYRAIAPFPHSSRLPAHPDS